MKKVNTTYFLLLIFSFCLTLIVSEFAGDKWENGIREVYYHHIRHGNVPANYTVLVDSGGVPFVEYTPYKNVHPGKQYLPTTISIYAINYYHELKRTKDAAVRKKFFNCIEWLARHITYRGNYALYEFTWQQPFYSYVETPWCSGLSSGKAIEAFTYAYEISHSPKYIDYARWLLRGFYQPIEKGGFTYKESDGWWYEEYADTNINTPHVLNGHVYAFLGVYQFWQATKNDSAAFIFNKGLESLKSNLNKYDAGNGWSYYDLRRKKSDNQYHKVMVELMEQLWKITGDELYRSYYKKWKAPLDEFYFVRIIKDRNRSGIILFLLLNLTFATVLSITVLYYHF